MGSLGGKALTSCFTGIIRPVYSYAGPAHRVGEEGCDYLIVMARDAKGLHVLDYETRSANT